MSDEVKTFLGAIEVHTTSGRGFSPEELAERALNKIIYVGSNAHPAIRDQAEAFKDSIRHILIYYLTEAARGERVTIANKLRTEGFAEMIPILDS